MLAAYNSSSTTCTSCVMKVTNQLGLLDSEIFQKRAYSSTELFIGLQKPRSAPPAMATQNSVVGTLPNRFSTTACLFLTTNSQSLAPVLSDNNIPTILVKCLPRSEVVERVPHRSVAARHNLCCPIGDARKRVQSLGSMVLKTHLVSKGPYKQRDTLTSLHHQIAES